MTARIAVAMSGGVDSSVAAALLAEAGHEVVGVTLKLHACEGGQATRSCCGIDAVARARAIAGQLGIHHYELDCVREFERQVLRPVWEEYARGRTPSPCLLCNERIKFGRLLAWARSIGAEALATGHYARIEADPAGAPILLRGRDPDRDQSYFLAGLDRGTLGRVRFPLGHLEKPEVRALARERGLATADTKDSQDACLVAPGESFAEMLRERFGAPARPGPVVDEAGQERGRHPGLHLFTVGQRKRIGIQSTRRHWVLSLRPEDAAVVVTFDEQKLMRAGLVAEGCAWIGEAPAGLCEVQIRSRHEAVPAEVHSIGPDAVRVDFLRPVRAVTPGQAAVFYQGPRVLGRGWIDAAL